ncbi:hypothetical protein MRB53_015727 [Persea americana]|uniref:Uncharacterized protein n=1 Tax=Persea americana TaxID=3435 RepID=A0ACC2M0R9_PERAE|nr:hypothetical protein MRB53_015727 [Persea americana]
MARPHAREKAIVGGQRGKEMARPHADALPPIGLSDVRVVDQLMKQLTLEDRRRKAIHHLCEEIVTIYRYLSPPALSIDEAKRISDALALFQHVAGHPDTRTPFLNAHLPLYLYPFLSTKDKTPALHQLRFSSLKVIVELIKDDNTEVVSFLLQTEIIPLCLQTVDFGDEATKTAATFILHKILFNDAGLRYICIASDRIFALVCNLWNAVASPSEPSPRLLKNIIHCCLRLTDDSRASDILTNWLLKNWLPNLLRDAAFCGCLNKDPANVILFQQFLLKLNRQNHPSTFQAGGT